MTEHLGRLRGGLLEDALVDCGLGRGRSEVSVGDRRGMSLSGETVVMSLVSTVGGSAVTMMLWRSCCSGPGLWCWLRGWRVGRSVGVAVWRCG